MLQLIEKTNESGTAAMTTLTLPFEFRQKGRQRVRLDNGQDAALFLKRGSVLYNNDLLISENKTIVRVRAADELLTAASCKEHLLFSRACYHLGNRHVVLQIEPQLLLYRHDHVLDDMLQRLGLDIALINQPFEPEPGAYFGEQLVHGH